MKTSAITIAAASLCALAGLAPFGVAHAQSNVTIYGLLDTGIDNVNNTQAGGGTMTRVSSGGMNTSRFGFRGTEDLGGGLSAIFNLEGGILMDSGASDGALFKRQAWVGLDGSLGRIVLGRSFTTVYDFMISYDPMGYAPFYSWATSTNASGASKYGMTTAYDNLVKYSGKTGNFKYGATFGLGEQADSNTAGRKMSFGADYAMGPFSVVATYERVNGNTLPANGERDKTTVYHGGAMYKEGPLKIQAAVRDYKLDPGVAAAADVRGRLYWAGASYQTTPVITLTGVVYYQDVKNVAAGADADPIMYVARFRYAASKRTDLYVAAAFAKAKHEQLVSVSRDEAGFADTQRGIIAGIQHRF